MAYKLSYTLGKVPRGYSILAYDDDTAMFSSYRGDDISVEQWTTGKIIANFSLSERPVVSDLNVSADLIAMGMSDGTMVVRSIKAF